MIINFFTTSFRQLWRNKTFTLLNILGLSLGISVCWITYRMVDYEYSFDKNHPDNDRIYQLVTQAEYQGNERKMAGVNRGMLPVLLNDVSGIEAVAPVYYGWNERLKITAQGNAKPLEKEEGLMYVSTLPGYFDMLPYKWLAGDKKTALNAPDKIVLTQKRANEYFPGLSPDAIVGKVLTYNDTIQKQISGVVANLNFPSSFNIDEFAALPAEAVNSSDWHAIISYDLIFVKLKEDVGIKQVLGQSNKIFADRKKGQFEKYQYKDWLAALPIREVHFATEYVSEFRPVNKKVLAGIVAVAVFLLTLACINYINISTAQLPQRAKEIGIRKTLGSSGRQLMWRFIGETAFITAMAAVLSFILSFLGLRLLKDFIPEGMENYMNYPGMAIFLVLLVIIISVLSGLYPAWLSTKVKTVEVMKGQTIKGIGGHKIPLRKVLVVFQFLIAQVFIIGAFITGQQLQYMLNKDLGFDKEAVITLEVPRKSLSMPGYADKKKRFIQKLQQHPFIVSASLGDKPMANGMVGRSVYYATDTGEVRAQLNFKFGDTSYLNVYKFKLLAGRSVRPSDTTNEYLINETAVKKFGFKSPADAVGKHLASEDNPTGFPIVGVVKDYHQFGFHREINAAAIVASSDRTTFNIRLGSAPEHNWNPLIAAIEKEWKTIYPGFPFDYKFYDETIAEMIEPDIKTATLINLITGIAIFISCLGLFGLTTLIAFQRSKEIGIRKVLGSSIAGIVQLLAKDFVKLVILSIIIATPIAWWAMSKWLQDFAFPVKIEWWMFLITGLVAILIALITVSFQSIKAALVNPVKTLRTE